MVGDDLVPLEEWHVTLYAAAGLPDDEADELRRQAGAAIDECVRRVSTVLGSSGPGQLRIN